ncbi:MAG: hypothetical protein M9920_08720 [Verrucomicrobiae bacterium]|nr:hypothetical protein [Verrucomicrobiae bacterium]
MSSMFRRLAYKLSMLGYFKETCRKFYQTPANLERQTLLAQHQYLRGLLAEPRYAEPKRLCRHEQQVFSQNGEDGAVAEIFRRIGTKDRTFVEIGVSEGLENNTTFLLVQGWKGFWFDGDDAAIAKIQRHFWQPLAAGNLKLKRAFINAENISSLIDAAGVPREFDLFSIDIDRNTYFVWQALTTIQPRVVVVEYNSLFPPDVDWKVEYRPELVFNCTTYMGASLKAYERLGAEKGYALVGCDLSGMNAYFVRKDLVGDQFAEPFTAANHYEPPRHFLIRRDGLPRCFSDVPPPP